MSYITTVKRFHAGKRYYPGDKFPYAGDPAKAPSGVIPAKDYDPPKDTPTPGAGLAVKADSISDIPIAGQGENKKPVSDAAKQLADAMSINLDDVKGTGTGGQITKTDVNRYIAENTGNS